MNRILKFSPIAVFAALVLAFFACSDSPTKKKDPCVEDPYSEECLANPGTSSGGGGDPGTSSTGDGTSSSEPGSSSSSEVTATTVGKDQEVDFPAGETTIELTIPTSDWQYNDAYVSCNNNNQGKTCNITATPYCGDTPTGTVANLSGEHYLGRESIGKPTCETFKLKIEASADCIAKCTVS